MANDENVVVMLAVLAGANSEAEGSECEAVRDQRSSLPVSILFSRDDRQPGQPTSTPHRTLSLHSFDEKQRHSPL